MVNVGIYSFGTNHSIDKYFQIMSVLNEIEKNDTRFKLSTVVDGTGIASNDLFNYYPHAEFVDLRKVDINDSGLDCIIVIDPYSRPYTPYSKWRVPIIYKEYGVAGAEAGAGYLINKSVYRYADLIITDNSFMKDKIKEAYPEKKVVVGSPAFDFAVNNPNCRSTVLRSFKQLDDGTLVSRKGCSHPFNVLWTPHHSVESKPSFDKIEGGTYSTFVEYKDYLVGDFLRNNPDINLMIKYHPILPKRYNAYCKHNGIDDTFARWVKKVKSSEFKDRISFYDKSDYHELFEKADIILNDSISFLQEWLPTGKPMIVLRTPKTSQFSPYGESLISSCYESVYNVETLDKVFQERTDFTQYNEDKDRKIRDLYIEHGQTNSSQLVEIIYNLYNK